MSCFTNVVKIPRGTIFSNSVSKIVFLEVNYLYKTRAFCDKKSRQGPNIYRKAIDSNKKVPSGT